MANSESITFEDKQLKCFELKFGDGDLCSKRRKLHDISLRDNELTANSNQLKGFDDEISEKCLPNSSTIGIAKEDSDKSSEAKKEKKCAKKDSLTYTTKPSTSSKGFDNTFALLQSQVECNKEKSFKILSNIKVNQSLLEKYSLTEQEEDARMSCGISEIEITEGINTLIKEVKQRQSMEAALPLLTFFLNLVSRCQTEDALNAASNTLLSSQLKSHENSNGKIIYYAAKKPDGVMSLKIVRNLLRSEVLCGNRISQMTRAYDDIEAVTRLLEEKEKDLELTVQIGKELLAQNNVLENKILELESDLKTVNEDHAQLLHELRKKNELIAVLTSDSDTETPTYTKSITVELLQKKINSLEDENKSLKMEASELVHQTDAVEAHERQLMDDITTQLGDVNKQFENLSLDLERQREENRLQHEQIVSLTARLAEAEMRLHQLTHDNDENVTLLSITKENQNSLALELVEFKQRYQEVLALLQETQEQLRKYRKKSMPQARNTFMPSMVHLQSDSLQSELMESSLYSENSLDSGISNDNLRFNNSSGQIMPKLLNEIGLPALNNTVISSANTCAYTSVPFPSYKRVFDTIKCAKSGTASNIGSMSMSSVSGPRMSTMIYGDKQLDENNFNSENAFTLRSASCESLASQSDDCFSQPSGVPGVPGAKELEAALKRLTPAEVLARRAMLSYAPAGTYSYDENLPMAGLPLGIRTPDSIMSTGSSGVSSTNMSSTIHQWRLPEKLQIVKPMEGSQTLHHWSRLATPTLSGLLEERPGVTIRGGRGLEELGLQLYTLNDIEEDVPDELPGKQFEVSYCTYTYTTSTVMHPDDGFINDASFLSQSQMSSRMASTSTSRQPSCPPTPRAGLSRKNSCCTFSVNLGLASMLNERGIKAVTPSALNTPAGPNFSPTVTPYNSPEDSPTRSRSPEPLFNLLSSGADVFRRKLIGGDVERSRTQQQKQQKIMLTRLERRALRSLRLLEKVESIGLENIITTQPNAMSQLTSGIANRSISPMAQLTSLKNINPNPNSNIVKNLHFDRNQIKDVLQKGLSPQAALPVNKKVKEKSEHDNDPKVSNINKVAISADPQSNPTPINYHDEATTNARSKPIHRQKSRRNLKNGQRPDLGTIEGRVRTDLGRVSPRTNRNQQQSSTQRVVNETGANKSSSTSNGRDNEQTLTQSFVGTVSSLIFGRKGGWL